MAQPHSLLRCSSHLRYISPSRWYLPHLIGALYGSVLRGVQSFTPLGHKVSKLKPCVINCMTRNMPLYRPMYLCLGRGVAQHDKQIFAGLPAGDGFDFAQASLTNDESAYPAHCLPRRSRELLDPCLPGPLSPAPVMVTMESQAYSFLAIKAVQS